LILLFLHCLTLVHLFIEGEIVDSLAIKPNNIHESIFVLNHIRGLTHLSMLYCKLKLVIHSVEFTCDAYILNFLGYGLIWEWIGCLFMWIMLDCDRRIVWLKKDEGFDLLICHKLNISILETYLYSLGYHGSSYC